jgi:UDP-N-acetyl-D-galactosamine dehydrogenase
MSNQHDIAVLGLGYVGLSIAVALGNIEPIIGFDTNSSKITNLQKGNDITGTMTEQELRNADILYTTNTQDLKNSRFYIVAVPTPVDENQKPDLSIIKLVSETIGSLLDVGDIVVYESTFYPGFTENKCIPLLEKFSGLKCGQDFGVAYSPERVNPGDKQNTLKNVTKIVSAINYDTLTKVVEIYSRIIKNIYPVSSIKVAEATKILENVQRDVNVAYLNEATMLLHVMGMEITEVLAAMQTKWNALSFRPGLVGGHCIALNSLYLTELADNLEFPVNVVKAAREANNKMLEFIEKNMVAMFEKKQISIDRARIGIMGITFKENCSDIHDSLVINFIQKIETYGAEVLLYDPVAEATVHSMGFRHKLLAWDDMYNLDAIILMVAHQEFFNIEQEIINRISKKGFVMDIKGILTAEIFTQSNITLWQI